MISHSMRGMDSQLLLYLTQCTLDYALELLVLVIPYSSLLRDLLSAFSLFPRTTLSHHDRFLPGQFSIFGSFYMCSSTASRIRTIL